MDLFKTMYSMTIASVALLLIAVLGLASYSLEAAELNTQLPAANTSSGTLTPVNIDLPSQPLDASLKQLARTTGISVAFDSKLATGKTAPAVKGRMKADEALKMLLAGSGLESSIDKDSAVINQQWKSRRLISRWMRLKCAPSVFMRSVHCLVWGLPRKKFQAMCRA
ncbi:STN domain-containing protein [Methylobacillus glycogenes]|uniref:STN domain-containing protein n=1 Tax=Methylobacillus glycogenes TaxID=406 RepID=UPI0034E1E8A9